MNAMVIIYGNSYRRKYEGIGCMHCWVKIGSSIMETVLLKVHRRILLTALKKL